MTSASRTFGPTPLGALRRFAKRGPRAHPPSVCEICATPIREPHPHVVNLEDKRVLCVCAACHMLFSDDGRGRYRAVPDRRLYANASRARWGALGVPVSMAFVFHESKADRLVAFYPSPAGAVESVAGLEWRELLDLCPAFREMRSDVEALLVRETEGRGVDCFLVPVVVCYELVAKIRQTWRGFDGGEAARTELDAFFADLLEKSSLAFAPDEVAK